MLPFVLSVWVHVGTFFWRVSTQEASVTRLVMLLGFLRAGGDAHELARECRDSLQWGDTSALAWAL